MHPLLANYLTKVQARGARSRRLADRFALAAVQRLTRSRAYRTGDLAALKTLATASQVENAVTMIVATAHPDVFHPNVIRARQAENRVIDAVLRLLDQPAASVGKAGCRL